MAFLILGILLFANALFAMSELAIISSSRSRLEAKASSGHAGAAAALALAASPSRFLAIVQVGMTVTGILAGALGEAAIADDFADWLRQFPAIAPYARIIATVLVVAGITYATLIFAELVPKRIGMHWPEPIASIVSVPMLWISRVAAPLIWMLTRSTDFIAGIFGVRGRREETVSREEVRGMVARGAESGVFHETQQDLVERVFRFADMRVKALMVPRGDIVWIDAKESPERVRVIVAMHPFSHFLVGDGSLDKLVGVVHVKDLVKYGLIAGEPFAVRELARPPMFVPDQASAVQLLERFRETGHHLAVVVDEFGGTEGLVTLNDVVGAIVGEMGDLRDQDEPMAVRRADGSWSIDGRLPLPELCATFDLPPHAFDDLGNVHTAGGLMFTLLGRLPRVGDTRTHSGLSFEVVDTDRRRVDRLIVRRLERKDEEGPAGEGDAP